MQKDDKIIITGANGLLGSAMVQYLRQNGYKNVVGISRQDCDLLIHQMVTGFFNAHKPKYVFHCAALVFGINGIMQNKGRIFYENTHINTNVIDACRQAGVQKILCIGSGAMYPFPSPGLPLSEDMIFMGKPHFSVDSYGHTKIAMLNMLQAYYEQYGLQWAFGISCNLFGPRDKYDESHGLFIPSMIKKFHNAIKNNTDIEFWGDGSAMRDFMYVDDCARLCTNAMLKLNGPFNIGSGDVFSIRQIVETMAKITNFKNKIIWDTTKPAGQDYRSYNLQKIQNIGFQCQYSIEQGLAHAYKWYVDNV